MSEDDQKPPLDAALRHLAEQQRRSLTSHPTPPELAAYHAGELPPQAEAKILDHLAICRECSDLLLDLSGFADLKPPEGVPELTDAQVEEDWQKLRSRMKEGEGKKERTAEIVPMIRPAGVPPRPERDHSPWKLLAASLVMAVLGSYGLYYGIQAGKRVDQLREGQRPSVPDVFDLGTTLRGGTGGESSKMSSQKGGLFFLTPPEDFPAYRVEVRQDDVVLWTSSLLSGQESLDNIPINIPGGFLNPGSYKIRLYGGERGSDLTPLVDHDLEVE